MKTRKLTLDTIEDGIMIRCRACDCATTEKGYVEGAIHITRCSCGNIDCLEAYHDGNPFAFAYKLAPECPYAKTLLRPVGEWYWDGDDHPDITIIDDESLSK